MDLISWLGRHAYIRVLARLVYLVYYSVNLLVFMGLDCFCLGILQVPASNHVIFITIRGLSLKWNFMINLFNLKEYL